MDTYNRVMYWVAAIGVCLNLAIYLDVLTGQKAPSGFAMALAMVGLNLIILARFL